MPIHGKNSRAAWAHKSSRQKKNNKNDRSAPSFISSMGRRLIIRNIIRARAPCPPGGRGMNQ